MHDLRYDTTSRALVIHAFLLLWSVPFAARWKSMGCTGSKAGTARGSGREGRTSWRLLQPMTPNSADRRLMLALRDLKERMDEEHSILEAFSFTKIILKLGTIEKVLRRIKAVYRSVDHGNKGHVTKEELKEGLHKAKVDLGDEWLDTNIDECLEHLGGAGADHDQVGLREFVVMLAVGRVCRPLKRGSALFIPSEGKEDTTQRKEKRPSMGTIDENESRRPSLTPTAAAVAAAAAIAAAAADGDGDLFTTDPKVSDGQATGMEGNGTLWDSADEATSSASAETRAKGQDDVPTASAGPGGLPRASSWRDLKWARIPSLRSLEGSGRSMLNLRGLSGSSSGGVKGAGGSGVGVMGGGGETDVSQSVRYVLDLFIAAYFQFDTKGKGFITKSVVEKKLRQPERESGTSSLLDEKRWSELAWDGDRLSFQEFIYAFAQWLGLMEDDDDMSSMHSQSSHRGSFRTTGDSITMTASLLRARSDGSAVTPAASTGDIAAATATATATMATSTEDGVNTDPSSNAGIVAEERRTATGRKEDNAVALLCDGVGAGEEKEERGYTAAVVRSGEGETSTAGPTDLLRPLEDAENVEEGNFF